MVGERPLTARSSRPLLLALLPLAACGGSGADDARLPDDVIQIAAAADTACALRGDGQVRCWGQVHVGTDARALDRATPIITLKGAAQLVVGDTHACARFQTGEVACWGDDGHGQLGDGKTTASATAVLVPGLTDAVDLSAASRQTCAVRQSGKVVCWGAVPFVSDDPDATFSTPFEVPGVDDATAVSAGESGSCALRRAGAVVCWGRGTHGQLGAGGPAPDTCGKEPCARSAVAVAGLVDARQVSVGLDQACAVRASGEVVCWGWGAVGQNGDGTTLDRDAPVPVIGLGTVVSVRALHDRVCALRTGGELWCWGEGAAVDGLPDPSQGQAHLAPVRIPVGEPVLSVAGGHHQTCARAGGRVVLCWGGDNALGQLGDGTRTPRSTPADVAGL